MPEVHAVPAAEVRRRYQEIIDGTNPPELRREAGEHYYALNLVLNTFVSVNRIDEAAVTCRDFLRRGVPCVKMSTDLSALSELVHCFIVHAWPTARRQEIRQLMTEYHAAGHLDFTCRLPAFMTAGNRTDRTAEPCVLEAAVLAGHVPAVETLLDLGVTYDGDLLELIDLQQFLVNKGELRSAVVRWRMARELAATAGQALQPGLKIASRAGRTL